MGDHDEAPRGLQQPSERGYAHMRQSQEAEWDTLDDLDTSKIATLQELYHAVLGPVMCQPDLCGVLITGPRDVPSVQTVSQGWGKRGKGFENYDETWHVRSSPKGRIGKLVRRDEIRKIAILVRPGITNGKESRVTILKLWRITRVDIFNVCNQRYGGSYGAHGVHMVGLHLFEHHGRKLAAEKDYALGRNNYHAVHGAFVTAMCQAPAGMEVPEFMTNSEGRIVDSVQACPYHALCIASSLAHSEVNHCPYLSSDVPNSREVRREDLDHRRIEVATALVDLLLQTEHAHKRRVVPNTPCIEEYCSDLSKERVDVLAQKGSSFLAAAEVVSEQLSHNGFLDMAADSFFEGACPDAMHRPSGMPLLIAIAVRIACHPERIGLTPGTPDDQLAAREASKLLEAIQPAILPNGTGGGQGIDNEPYYAIDIVIQHTVKEMLAEISRIRDAQPTSALHKNVAGRGVDVNQVDRKFRDGLVAMYRAGVAVCVDLLGIIPLRDDSSAPSVYTPFGLAQSCYDAVEHARCADAYSNSLGYLRPRLDPMRATSLGAQQMVLAKTLLDVERWLCTGTYRGARLLVEENPGPDLEHINMHSLATSALSNCFSPTADESEEAVAHERERVANTSRGHSGLIGRALNEAVTNAHVAKMNGASKKKQKKAMRLGVQQIQEASRVRQKQLKEEEVVQQTATARGRRRSLADDHMIAKAVNSLKKKGSRYPLLEEAVRGLERGSGQVLDDATCLFSTVLQCGACTGATSILDFQTYLVGHGSVNACCNCKRPVNVVESVAFGGHHSACTRCHHPRCLACVQHDIDVLGGPSEELGLGAPYRYEPACQFCGES
jgi:hypothetical protein